MGGSGGGTGGGGCGAGGIGGGSCPGTKGGALGGSGGGGTQLTEYGKQKILDFDAMKHRCWEFIEEQNAEFNNQ